MKLTRIALAFVPMALGMAQLAAAGPFCGGCSDPCAPRHGLFGHHHRAAYSGYGYGYAAAPVCAAPAVSYGAPAYAYDAPAACAPATQTYYGDGTITADGGYATGAGAAPATQSLCEPVTGYRVVMEPQFVTETVAQPSTELQTETRQRVKTVNKTVPVKFQSYRVKNTIKPVTETKTVEYSVLVPETSEKTVDVTASVPVWKDVSENYTVKVPEVVDIPEQYTVKVPTIRDEEFTYTVQVPQTQTVTKTQTVTNAVPVTKTRAVQRSVPVYSSKSVQRDYGHWETVVDEVAAPAVVAAPVTNCNGGAYVANGCGSYAGNGCGCAAPAPACGCAPAVSSGCGCGSVAAVNGCGSNFGCGSVAYAGPAAAYSAPACGSAVQTASRRVWVPNVVTEEVPVVESKLTSEEISYTVYEQETQEVPYECTYLVYKPEQRTGTRKVVDYNTESRTRNRKVVQYKDESRTRTRKVMNYETQTKTETYPYVSYRTDKRTKQVSFTIQVPEQSVEPYEETRYEQVTEQVVEDYTVQVSVPTTKEAQVQVMRMVPKLVPYTYTPCCSSTSTGGYSVDGAASGCGTGYSVGGYDSGAVSGCGCSVAPAIATPCCN